jgi:hypothetical protein
VPSAAEIGSRIDAFSKDQWNRYTDKIVEMSRKRNETMEGMTAEEREAYEEENELTWLEESDRVRRDVQEGIKDYTRRVQEELTNRQAEQERLAFMLSRVSPASAYQLAAMNAADTDTGLKPRYVGAIENYRDLFFEHAEKKNQEAGGGFGGVRINFDTDSGLTVDSPRDRKTIDVSGMPAFTPPVRNVADILAGTVTDIVLLVLYTIAAMAGSFVAFLRYDVR